MRKVPARPGKPSLSGSSSKRSRRSTGHRGKPRPDPRQVLRMMASENTEKFADLRGRVTYTYVRAPTRPTVLYWRADHLSPPRAASGRFGPHLVDRSAIHSLGLNRHPIVVEALRLLNGRLTAGSVAPPQPAPAVWKPLPRVRTAMGHGQRRRLTQAAAGHGVSPRRWGGWGRLISVGSMRLPTSGGNEPRHSTRFFEHRDN